MSPVESSQNIYRRLLSTDIHYRFKNVVLFRMECCKEIQTPEFLKVYINGLKHPDKTVAGKAAGILLLKGDDRGKHLVIRLLKQGEWNEQLEILQLLSHVGSSRDILNILPLLSHKNKLVRSQAVWAIGKLGNFQMIPVLEQMVSDPDDLVSEYAFMALGELGDDSGIEVLMKHLNNRTLDNRVFAAASLYVQGVHDGYDILLRSLSRPKKYFQYVAVRTFAQHEREVARKVLKDLIEDTHFRYRDLAVLSYVYVHAVTDIPWYKGLYAAMNERGKKNILRAVVSFQRQQDYTWIVSCLKESETRACETFFSILADYRARDLFDVLFQFTRHPSLKLTPHLYIALSKHLREDHIEKVEKCITESASRYLRIGLSAARIMAAESVKYTLVY